MHPEMARQLIHYHCADLRRSAARSAPPRWRRWPRRLSGGGAPVTAPLALPDGAFLAEPQLHAFRVLLTPAELRRLARDWSRLAERASDPRRCPPDAVPVEVVVLGRRLPEPAGLAE
jgi:hypothetical protein